MTTGTVSNVASRQVNTKFGPKPAYDIFIDGTKYSAGFKKPVVAIGDAVEFEFKTSQYGNEIVNITKTGAGSLPPAASNAALPSPARPSFQAGGKGVFPIPALDGQRAIVRQNALTNARELVAGLVIASTEVKPGDAWTDRQRQLDTLSDEIIRIARKFEAYACGDVDREAAEKDMTK
jgi:hypothetical protein